MISVVEKPRAVTRALARRRVVETQTAEEGRSLLDELAELVDTLGLTTADSVLTRIDRPQASFLIGSGKAEEIVTQAKALEADVIIFDNELTPGQQRKFEELSGLAVIDREEVILDIFNGRARTKEPASRSNSRGWNIPCPRLARAWGHLSRQQGVGGKGEGESQLEPTAAWCASASTRSRPNSLTCEASAPPSASSANARPRPTRPSSATPTRANPACSNGSPAGTGRGGQAVRHARPHHPAHRPARRPTPAPDGYRRFSGASSRTGSSKPSSPRWKKRSSPTFSSICSMPASPRFSPSIKRRWTCWPNSARGKSVC